MNRIGELMPEKSQQWESWYKNLSEKDIAQYKIDRMNEQQGTLSSEIYDCHECKNRGYFFVLQERQTKEGKPIYFETYVDCKCMKIRKSVMNMKKSGLEPIIKRCTFDKYETPEEWQKKIKGMAQHFAENVDLLEKKWFFIGGGIGSGKTHLCTAIVRDLLKKGKEAKYMRWVKDGTKLKAMVNEPEYESAINEYRKADVLYIDDFFKITRDGKGNEQLPTAADIRLAYEIIDYRYQKAELITIISSERYIAEIENIDSAVGSRIYEMTEGNAVGVARDKNRNYRIRSMEIV